MKKGLSVVCLIVLVWHLGSRPSLAAGTEPPRLAAERPLAAAIASAGSRYGHLLSQTSSNRASASRQIKTILAAAIGFGAGFGYAYFTGESSEVRMGMGSICAVVAGYITYDLTGP